MVVWRPLLRVLYKVSRVSVYVAYVCCVCGGGAGGGGVDLDAERAI